MSSGNGLTAKVISWRSVTHTCFPGFLTPVLTQLFFPMPLTTFLTCFCRGERRKYAGKKSHLNQGSNSQPKGHESDTLTTEPPGPGRAGPGKKENAGNQDFFLFLMFLQSPSFELLTLSQTSPGFYVSAVQVF